MRQTLLATLLILAIVQPAVTSAELLEAHVTYVTTTTVYVDAGKLAGLAEGSRIEVRRQDGSLATLIVVSAASNKSACRFADPNQKILLKVGDAVHFQPVAASLQPSPNVGVVPNQRSRSHGWLRRHGVRGRVAVRFIGVEDKFRQGGGYTEPAFDARLDAGLSPDLRLSMDMRARHTYRATESVDRTRVYRLLGDWSRSSGGPRLVVGRQVAASFASVSVFDGALGEWRGGRWSIGAFTGTQPDPVDYGFSSQTREHGAYLEWRENPEGGSRWQLTAAGIGSYENATVNREYVALQGRLMTRQFNAYLLQEIDVNRGWKMVAGESRLSLTSILAQARLRLGRRWSVDGGFDNRRNVRLYRDRTTPETEFDDSYRQGAWGGVGLRLAQRTRLGVRARRSSGGAAGNATSFTGTLSSRMPHMKSLGLQARGTLYRNTVSTGWLASVSPSLDLGARLRTGVSLGRRLEENRLTLGREELNWFSTDFDLVLSYAWILAGAVEWSEGTSEKNTQYHTSLVLRF